jgi:hypothetical protein
MTHAQQARQFGTKARMTGTVAEARMACTHATTARVGAARYAAAITIATMPREQAIAFILTSEKPLQAIAGRVAATISAASAISTWRLG